MNYNFISLFDPDTGQYLRSSVIKDGKDTMKEPFMASYPELIDIGVMGHCIHGESGRCLKSGVQCYQNGLHENRPNMSLSDFRRIIFESREKVFQCALGGRGDVDQHEDFEQLLACCAACRIVPNFTTSGFGLTPEKAAICGKYCGAVAVSWYRQDYTLKAIRMLLNAGVKTNIHYVLGKNSIEEATERLLCNSFPEGINAVIFLLHKPVGLGTGANVLQAGDPEVLKFFELIDRGGFPYKVGFDSCSAAGVVNYTNQMDLHTLDFCEGARFSMYIDSQMRAMPCSFANQDPSWFIDLHKHTIREAWNSDVFERFRYSLRYSCPECPQKQHCAGGCPLVNEVTLCNRPERDFKKERKFENENQK
ncbi:MAG: SPASM domain-containing protein [Lachnospiraceae bacterium]|nr:SPASM domain-containing protein [Lachnospiraceae bacterium]